MRLPLRVLSDRRLRALHAAALTSVAAFVRATTQHGSLIQSWVGRAEPVALEHYPPGDVVVDRRRGAQFFYHCHRADGSEHGHLHLFWHATRSGRRRHWCGQAGWSRAEPSPLLSIGLDARGLPVSIFTVNHWVAGGHWFSSARLDWAADLSRLERELARRGLEAKDAS